MNPFDPWVALTEITGLLFIGFGLGYLIAKSQYSQPLECKKRLIRTLQQDLKTIDQANQKRVP